MPSTTDTDWDAAYAAFVGAFDTPLARRRDDNEFAQDARRRLSAFNETMQKAAADLAAARAEGMEAMRALVPRVCDGKEQEAFEAWAKSQHMDMHEHPLHYLFLNERTGAARDGWREAINYVQQTIGDAATRREKEAAELNDAWAAVAKWHDEQADKHGAWRDWGGPSDPVAQQKEAFHRECAKDLRARKVPKG